MPVTAETTTEREAFLKHDHVLWFDGLDDVVTVGKFKPIYENSVELWVRPEIEKSGSLFANGGGPRAVCGSGVHFAVGGKKSCYDVNPDKCGTDNKVCYFGNLAGEWVHIAGTYNGYTSSIYVNGEFVNAVEGVKFDTRDWLTIGNLRFYNGHNHPFGGQILEIRVWDFALPAERLKKDMYKRPDPKSDGLVAYWRFDQGEGQTILNQVNNKYAAVLGMTADQEFIDPTWIKVTDPAVEQSQFNADSQYLEY